MRTAAALALVVVAGTAGDLWLAHAMRQVGGDPARLSWSTIARPLRQALSLPALWLGIAGQAIAFFAFLALLSWADVSFVVPATAASYVVGAVGARCFLHERVTARRWAGVALISAGVVFVLSG